MKKVDLHIHTVATVSDHYFEFSMDTLQSYVECKELDAIAVTNHNLFDRKQYEEICEKISVPVFPGIEIDVEQGHLLLITSPDDLDDFEPRCKHIQGKNSTNTSWISEDDLLEYFPNIGKYILIPHYDKSPKLELHRIPKIKDYCYCFLLHGYTGMFDYWFKNGMKEPPKEMGPYVSEFRHDLIKNL